MPECRKWHFRASRFQNLPGEHSPEIPPRVRVRGLSAPEVFQLSTLMGSATYFRTYWNPWTLLGILFQNQITILLTGVQEMCQWHSAVVKWAQTTPLAFTLKTLPTYCSTVNAIYWISCFLNCIKCRFSCAIPMATIMMLFMTINSKRTLLFVSVSTKLIIKPIKSCTSRHCRLSCCSGSVIRYSDIHLYVKAVITAKVHLNSRIHCLGTPTQSPRCHIKTLCGGFDDVKYLVVFSWVV